MKTLGLTLLLSGLFALAVASIAQHYNKIHTSSDFPEYRCDHAKREALTTHCIQNLRAAEGSAQDCVYAADELACDYVRNGRSQSGRKWRYVDGQWRLP